MFSRSRRRLSDVRPRQSVSSGQATPQGAQSSPTFEAGRIREEDTWLDRAATDEAARASTDVASLLSASASSRGGFTARLLYGSGDPREIEDVLTGGRLTEPITRAEAAALVARVMNLGTALQGDPGVYSDVPVSHWAAAAIYRGRELGLFSGYGNNEFRPTDVLQADHAELVLERVENPSSRVEFDRSAARAQSDTHREAPSGSDEGVLARVAESMSEAEGTDPDRIHYDSGIVNWGVGSNTGTHIATLLELYERTAVERGLEEQLYWHFGSRGAFEVVRDRFSRQGQGARLSQDEANALRRLGRDKDLVDVQYQKASEDVAKYVGQVGAFAPPYPYAVQGQISELAAHVFSHAAHQSGSAIRVYGAVMQEFGGRDPSSQVSESEFLRRVGDKIVSWVERRYRRGVENRYRTLFESYEGSGQMVSIGGAAQRVVVEGQITEQGAGVGGLELELEDELNTIHQLKTTSNGFFELPGGLSAGVVRVRVAGRVTEVQATLGQATWVQLDLSTLNASVEPQSRTGIDEEPKESVQTGSRGEAVMELQQALADLGLLTGAPDGAFGPKTEQAVKAFQRQRGLLVDGVAGAETWAALDASSSRDTSPPGVADTETVAAPDDVDPAWVGIIGDLCTLIVEGQMNLAKQSASRMATQYRVEQGLERSESHPVTSALGRVYQVAAQLGMLQLQLAKADYEAVKRLAALAADNTRQLRAQGWVDVEVSTRLIQAAGGWWTKANEAMEEGDVGQEYLLYSTGRAQSHSAGNRRQAAAEDRRGNRVQTRQLDAGGDWSPQEWGHHHQDRSNSWAARQIRNRENDDLQGYDFTFLRPDTRGNPIASESGRGLELITPWEARVLNIQTTYEGSGGLGQFIVLESIETGLRLSIHHLDRVADVRIGQVVEGGEVIGTQGGSGRGRSSYPVHVDIVGTQLAVEQFVRSNQSGTFNRKVTSR